MMPLALKGLGAVAPMPDGIEAVQLRFCSRSPDPNKFLATRFCTLGMPSALRLEPAMWWACVRLLWSNTE